VFFTPYRPWLLPNDLAFFDLAREAGFVVNKFFEHTMDKVMFEEDPGVSDQKSSTDNARARDADLSQQDELLRRTVFGYSITWAKDQLS